MRESRVQAFREGGARPGAGAGRPGGFAAAMSRRDIARMTLALGMLAAPGWAAAGSGRVHRIDSTNVDWDAIAPGDEVLLAPGTWRRAMTVRARGTAEAPILVRPEEPGTVTFNNSIVFEGAAHVVLTGVEVSRARHSGVILRHGSEAITVEGVTVRNSGLGIWIGDGAGASHRLIGNTLTGNRTHGIAIDELNAAPGAETLIEGNVVTDNGMHGMEIDGSHYIVLRNRVHRSGRQLSGCSGIHTFCRTPDRPFGKHNVIAFNIVSGTQETTGQDGNGIQADQWCDDNLIAFNICFDNDGAGVNLFDASRTGVFHNTLVGNMIDSGGRHAYKAEVSLASDFTREMERPEGNRILNNILSATNPEAVAVFVEATAASRPQEIGNNLLHHARGGLLAHWAPTNWRGVSISEWNALAGGVPDLAGDPMFPAAATSTGERFLPSPEAARAVAPVAVPWLAEAGLVAPGETPDHLGALPVDG